tara:strand:- start:97 stop:771 length:675 start_codon:yes stop_codon:yes gene_type:complete
MVTSDLNKFGRREKDMMVDLFVLYRDNKITKIAKDYFDFGTMKPAYNINSGYVFLTDDDYNVVMENDGMLDLFISTPYAGVEGFYDDLMEDEYFDMDEEDKEYMDSLQGHKMMKKSKTNKINKIMNGNCAMDGFSRVVVPSELNGFTRVNMVLPENMQGYTLNDYRLNDYELNEMQGRTARKIARFYRKNAPWSYIGTAVAGVVIADILTKGAVRKKLGLKKGR